MSDSLPSGRIAWEPTATSPTGRLYRRFRPPLGEVNPGAASGNRPNASSSSPRCSTPRPPALHVGIQPQSDVWAWRAPGRCPDPTQLPKASSTDLACSE